MKVFVIGLLLCVAAVLASENSVQNFEPEQEQYLVNIENVDGEGDIFDYIFPKFDEENEIDPSSRLWFAGWQARKELKKIQKQMPCGFPSYGIPPLAPYTNEDLVLHLKKSVLSTITDLIHVRVDGLDKFLIKKFKIGVINKKVTYEFAFQEVRFRSLLDTNTFLDLMRQYGFDVRYEGKGDIDFSLKHLNIKGSFKYKMPMLWGSMKIYKFNCVVTLRDCDSNIHLDLLGDGSISRKVNDLIEETVLSAINDNQKEISDRIEEAIVPRVNEVLKGHKIWYLFSLIGGGFGNTGSKCVPPPEPWYN